MTVFVFVKVVNIARNSYSGYLRALLYCEVTLSFFSHQDVIRYCLICTISPEFEVEVVTLAQFLKGNKKVASLFTLSTTTLTSRRKVSSCCVYLLNRLIEFSYYAALPAVWIHIGPKNPEQTSFPF